MGKHGSGYKCHQRGESWRGFSALDQRIVDTLREKGEFAASKHKPTVYFGIGGDLNKQFWIHMNTLVARGTVVVAMTAAGTRVFRLARPAQ